MDFIALLVAALINAADAVVPTTEPPAIVQEHVPNEPETGVGTDEETADPEPNEPWNGGEPVTCEAPWVFVENGDEDYCEITDHKGNGLAEDGINEDWFAE